MARPKVIWYRQFTPDIFGGIGKDNNVSCRIIVRANNISAETQVIGAYCVEAGSVFSPGPDIGAIDTQEGAGQVGC